LALIKKSACTTPCVKYHQFEASSPRWWIPACRSTGAGWDDVQPGQSAQEQGALNRINEVFAEIPRVREDLGFPPLVTPTS
jgi:pyruvate carboxylase subunit B